MSNVILKMTPKRIYPILRHDVQNAPIDLAHRRSAEYFGGVGFIAGRFPGTLTVDGQPAARVIECRTRDNRKLVATTWSNPIDGTYVFHNINVDLEYDLIARDHNRVYSDVIIPAVKPWGYQITASHFFNTVYQGGEASLTTTLSGGATPYTIVQDTPNTTVSLDGQELTIDVSATDKNEFVSVTVFDSDGNSITLSTIMNAPPAMWRIYTTEVHNGWWGSVQELEMYEDVMDPVNVCLTENGEPISSSDYDTRYSRFRAFDGQKQNSGHWSPNNSQPPSWIGFHFNKPFDITAFELTAPSGSSRTQAPKAFRLESSYDGVTWEPVIEVDDTYPWLENESRIFYKDAVDHEFVAVTQSSAYSSQFVGTVSNLTDNNNSTGVGTESSPAEWVEVDLGEKKTVYEVGVAGGNMPAWGLVSIYLNDAVIQYLNDEDEWETLNTITGVDDTGNIFFFRAVCEAQKIRILITDNYLSVTEIRVRGV